MNAIPSRGGGTLVELFAPAALGAMLTRSMAFDSQCSALLSSGLTRVRATRPWSSIRLASPLL